MKYVLDGMVFGYKLTRQEWTALCTIYGEDNLLNDLENSIYEFKKYVIIGQSVYVNTVDSESGAVDLTHLNQRLLEEKEEIDIIVGKMQNYTDYLYNVLPQIYFIHLITY